jgi:hypothetical protein
MPVCRLLPHGLYSLVPTVLASMALIAGHARDACRYAKLTEGELVDSIFTSLGDNAADDGSYYLEVGLNAYRVPGSRIDENVSEIPALNPRYCFRYPDVVTIDPIWHVARAASFLSVVLGGGAVFYLWISTCCRFNKSSWRCAAYEILLAALFQAVAFCWFASDICKTNTCKMDVGAQTDVVAIVIWLVAAASILLHFPKPAEITEGDGVMMASDDLELNVVSSSADGQGRGRGGTIAAIGERSTDAKKKQQGGPADGDAAMTTGEDSRQEGRKGLEDVQLS